MVKSSVSHVARGRGADRLTGFYRGMAACQTANTHTHKQARLMNVRTQIPDMPVHVTYGLVNTAVTLFLPLSLLSLQPT